MARMKAEMEVSEDRYRAPALDKGLDILEHLAGLEEGISQAEIAAALNRKPNEIYRMLDRLVKRGFVVRTSVDQYQLSLKLFELAHRQSPMRRLVVQSIPHLRNFAEAAQQGCHIAVYERGGLTAIAQVDAPGYWGFGIRVGVRFALQDSSSGHVLLAFASPQERQFMMAQSEMAETSLSAELLENLTRIQKQGYEIMPSQQVEGVYNIAVPLFNSGGQAIAALACPWVKHLDHMNNPPREAVLELLFSTAEHIRSGNAND